MDKNMSGKIEKKIALINYYFISTQGCIILSQLL